MRLIDLLENYPDPEVNSHYPKELSSDQIEKFVLGMHQDGNDDDDLIKRIHKFSKYHLVWMDPDKFRRNQHYVDSNIVSKYISKIYNGSPIPPIVVDDTGIIIDGTHRHEASINADVSKIPVYVGTSDASLYEGRDAPLYHGTALKSLLHIINTDELLGTKGYDDAYSGKSIRFSRSFNVAKFFMGGLHGDFIGGVLEFDQAKLNHNYKIFPYSDVEAGASRNTGTSEFEEVIIADSISPVLQYVKTIWLDEGSLNASMKPERLKMMSEQDFNDMPVEDIKEQIMKVVNHPKTKIRKIIK